MSLSSTPTSGEEATSARIRQLARQLELELPPAVAAPNPAAAAWADVACLLAAWVERDQPSVIAISGSQGSGKSTLAASLEKQLQPSAQGAVAVSLDDFYLGRAARLALADRVHPLLATRGVPGTHDCARLAATLEVCRGGGGTLDLPQFNKGRDDTGAERRVVVQQLILEGWCLGVHAQPEPQLQAPVNDLEAREDEEGLWRHWVNAQLLDHYQPLWASVGLWVHLRVPSFAQVLAWRTQQEAQLPAAQRMSAAALERFIQHYERLTRALWAQPPQAPGLVVELDAAHQIAKVQILP